MRFHRGLGLVLFNIFISDPIDRIDYAYYICRQHQIVSMLEDKIRIQNDHDKSEKFLNNRMLSKRDRCKFHVGSNIQQYTMSE